MRAAILSTPGMPVFGQFGSPEPVPGKAVVEVEVAGLNPIDLFLARGATVLPQVPGREGVGNLDKRRVYFTSVGAPFGSLAEKSIVDPTKVLAIPDSVSSEMAVTLGIAGLTAWLALTSRAKMQRGEHVVVLGSSGAVGTIALQVARSLGAGCVIAASRSSDSLAHAKMLGADATVSLANLDGLTDRIRDAGTGRVDIILDTLWGDPALAALKALSPGGRLIQIGSSAAASVELNPAFMRMPQSSILGFSGGSVSHEERVEAYAQLCDHAARQQIHIDIEKISLENIRAAWEKQALFPKKKLVIEI
jgi:NADPH2:quinone reductase